MHFQDPQGIENPSYKITLQEKEKGGDVHFFVSLVNSEKIALNTHFSPILRIIWEIDRLFHREFKTNNLKTFTSHRNRKHKHTQDIRTGIRENVENVCAIEPENVNRETSQTEAIQMTQLRKSI